MSSIKFEVKGGVLTRGNFNPFVYRRNHWQIIKNDFEEPIKIVFGEEPRWEPIGEIVWIFSPFSWVTRLVYCERLNLNYIGIVFSVESDKFIRCKIYDKHVFTEEPVETYDYVTRINVNLLRTLHIRETDRKNVEVFVNFEIFYQTHDGIKSIVTRDIAYWKHDSVGDGEYIRFTEAVNLMVDTVINQYIKVFGENRKKSFFSTLVVPHNSLRSTDTAAESIHTIVSQIDVKPPPVFQRPGSARVTTPGSARVTTPGSATRPPTGRPPSASSGRPSSASIRNNKITPMPTLQITGRQESFRLPLSIYEVAVPPGFKEGSTFQFVDNFGVPIQVVVPKGSYPGSMVQVKVQL